MWPNPLTYLTSKGTWTPLCIVLLHCGTRPPSDHPHVTDSFAFPLSFVVAETAISIT
jgi:hypothetical protein